MCTLATAAIIINPVKYAVEITTYIVMPNSNFQVLYGSVHGERTRSRRAPAAPAVHLGTGPDRPAAQARVGDGGGALAARDRACSLPTASQLNDLRQWAADS